MFVFSLKSALVLALLYLPYRVLMHRETFFHFNRMVLVGIMLVALGLPLVPIQFPAPSPLPEEARGVIEEGLVATAAVSDQAQHSPVLRRLPPLSSPGWLDGSWSWKWVEWLYALVAVGLLAGRLWGFVRLRRIVRHSSIEHLRQDGLHIYIHAGDVAPFSWGRSIVIGQKDYEAHGREILLHEAGHIRLHHSADVVLLTACQMLQWFNPCVWMMGRSLTDLHEYEADDYVLRQGVDVRTYQRLLVWRASGIVRPAVVQSFEGSLTRKRIMMMLATRQSASRSSGLGRLRVLYVVPVVLLSVGIFATRGFGEIRAVVDEKDPTVPIIAKTLSSLSSPLLTSRAWLDEMLAPTRTDERAAPALEHPTHEASASLTEEAAEEALPTDVPSPHPASPAVASARPEPQRVPADEPVDLPPSPPNWERAGEVASVSPPEVHRFSSPSIAAKAVRIEVNPESERVIDLGYGGLKKKHVSSNVNGYTGEELKKTGYSSLPEAIACKVPGLTYVGGQFVYRNSTVSLFFVDGIVASSITYISLGDVDHVEFDSEAFIYGSLGSYAIRVHTKR